MVKRCIQHGRCHHCGDLTDWSTGPEFDEGICEDCMVSLVRPNTLRAKDFNFGEKHERAIGFIALFYARYS